AGQFVAAKSRRSSIPLSKDNGLVKISQLTRFVLTWAVNPLRSPENKAAPSESCADTAKLPSSSQCGLTKRSGTRTLSTALLLIALPPSLLTMTAYVPESWRVALEILSDDRVWPESPLPF